MDEANKKRFSSANAQEARGAGTPDRAANARFKFKPHTKSQPVRILQHGHRLAID
jgi:hypothetical protein